MVRSECLLHIPIELRDGAVLRVKVRDVLVKEVVVIGRADRRVVNVVGS